MKVGLSTLTAGFTDVVVTVPAAMGNFNPAQCDVIRFEVEADPAYGSSWLNPTIVVLDSVMSSNGVVNIPFDAEPPQNVFMSSGGRPLSGSSYVWAATYP
jgi:hypothetical protein